MTNRIVSLFICAAVLLTSLCSCSTLASTKEELATVLTVGDYKVPYEQYYYITMNLKRDMPGADADEIEKEAFEMLREIYAVFSVAEDFGISFDDKYIASVADDAAKLAIDECGSKDEYKKALGENYMNDSVFRFLKRHSQTADELLSAISASDKYPSGEKELRELILSDEFVCVKQIIILTKDSVTVGENTYFSTGDEHTDEEALALAEEARAKALAGEDFDTLMKEYSESINIDEYYVSRGMWEAADEDAVFALGVGEISPVVKGENGYSVYLACKKDEEYISNNLDELAQSYYEGQYNLLIEDRMAALEVKTNKTYDSYAAESEK